MKLLLSLLMGLLLIPLISYSAINSISLAQLVVLSNDTAPQQFSSTDLLNKTTLDQLLQTNIPEGTGKFASIQAVSLTPGDSSTSSFAFVGAGPQNQLGIYFMKNGSLKMILNQKTEIPNGSGYFKEINDLCLNAKNGNVSFTGNGILGQEGIYTYEDGKLTKAVDQQTISPQGGALFKNFYNMACNNDLIVFLAKDQTGRSGIFAYIFSEGNLIKILSEKDKINGKTIQSLSLSQNALQGNKLYFHAILDNNQKVTYVATLQYIPIVIENAKIMTNSFVQNETVLNK